MPHIDPLRKQFPLRSVPTERLRQAAEELRLLRATGHPREHLLLGWLAHTYGSDTTGEQVRDALELVRSESRLPGSAIEDAEVAEDLESVHRAAAALHSDELRFAMGCAADASAMILAIVSEGREAGMADAVLVRRAGREIEEWFTAEVAARFPGDGVLGAAASGATHRSRTWAIQTVTEKWEFVLASRIPVALITIALVEHDEPIVAAVYKPSIRACYWATAGSGAYRDQTRIHHSTRDGSSRPVTINGTGADVPAALRLLVEEGGGEVDYRLGDASAP